MSYPPHDPYQQGNAHGGQSYVPGQDNRRTSRSHSLQLPVQVGGNPLVNRSLSTSRSPVTGQAQPFDTYGMGQNREPGLQHVHTPQYTGPQGQSHGTSFQEPPYQPVESYFQQPDVLPAHLVSPQNRTSHSPPQQPSVPYSAPHSAHAQYPHFQRENLGYPSRNPQQQRSSPPRYPQQQQPSPQQYPRQQPPSPQQYPHQQQSSPPRQRAAVAPNVPGAIHEMPGEVPRQSRSMHRDTMQSGPPCRSPNCRRPADRDRLTQELTEYCSLDHMQDDIRRGVPLCPACNMCPRRMDSNYCGSSCERWDAQRQQQPQRDQPSGVRPHSVAPPSGNVSWGAATTGNPEANYQHLSPPHRPAVGGLVPCPRCGTTYSARGRSLPRYETGQGDPVGYMSLPPCPNCGYSR